MKTRLFITTVLILHAFVGVRANDEKDENAGRTYMQKLNKIKAEENNKGTLASWAYDSNITDETLQLQKDEGEKEVKECKISIYGEQMEQVNEFAYLTYKFSKEGRMSVEIEKRVVTGRKDLGALLNVSAELARAAKEHWKELITYPWQTYKDADLRRQFQKYSVLGQAVLSDEKFDKLNKVVSEMASIYSTAKICDYKDSTKCDLSLEPDLENILMHSDNADELKHVWTEWRKASGQKVRKLYDEYVTLSNEAAVLNNFTDTSESWLRDYEDPTFRDQILKLWQQLRPLYLQIHAYLRAKLRTKYGEEIVPKKGTIPAHLFGNMWAQEATNTYPYAIPYPDAKGEDITKEMIKQGYTALKMFKMSETFFTSLNLSAMPDLFWERSILEKPDDGRELVCHASAWDFYDQKDFRIKQCTQVNIIDFETAHHEMGHIQYFIQYKDQPNVYREGANPGFHEAIGDVMSLSVSTNRHLHKIGLLKDYVDNPEVTINKLLETGLSKIIFLPFAYIMDLWRWDVFKGKITADNYNEEWWKLRQQYQGIHPPVTRSENDFDPGAKYHIIASVPYIRYFVSFVIQFQFHKTLCEKAGQYEPNNPEKALYKCDIYESKEAGNALAKLLKMGSSKPWHDAMEVLTGSREMDASALLEYFRPLQEWLEKENKKNEEYIGWEANDCVMCPFKK